MIAAGDLVCLRGEMGAGKTTFVQGMAQGWGSLDGVTSPTFILVNEYRRPDGAFLFHMDGYRLESGMAALELDIDRMLTRGALVVEWPERVGAALPAEQLRITMEDVAEEQRHVGFSAKGARYDELLEGLQHALFGVA